MFKKLSLCILIAGQLTMGMCSYADNTALSALSNFESRQTSTLQDFQQTAVLLNAFESIGEYLFGDKKQAKKPLPISFLQQVLGSRIAGVRDEISLEQIIFYDNKIFIPVKDNAQKVFVMGMKNEKDKIG